MMTIACLGETQVHGLFVRSTSILFKSDPQGRPESNLLLELKKFKKKCKKKRRMASLPAVEV